MRRALLVIVVSLGMARMAAANDTAPRATGKAAVNETGSRAAGKATATEKKIVLIDFSDVSIEGDLRKPDGAYYGSRKRTRFGSLIKVREQFLEEIKASVDSL